MNQSHKKIRITFIDLLSSNFEYLIVIISFFGQVLIFPRLVFQV